MGKTLKRAAIRPTSKAVVAEPTLSTDHAPAAGMLVLSEGRDIPFNRLRLSQANVRQTQAGVSIEDLAEDIARRTLLSSLTVRPVLDARGVETGEYEVPAGGRRFRALERLVRQGRLAPDAPVPCIVRRDGIAEEDSLAENIQRASLHPLDQFRAFAALRERGQSEEQIAAAFFVSTHVVRQRLRLAAVHPDILAAYAGDALSLEQLMAFTLNPDQARQLEVWTAVRQGARGDAVGLRRMLAEGAVRASDRRARLVGAEAYEAAGGRMLRDLFEADDGGWWQDGGLLEQLAQEALAAAADAVRAEGWLWVEAVFDLPYGRTWGLGRITGEQSPLEAEASDHLAGLKSRLATLEAEWAHAEELPDAVDREIGAMELEIEAIETRPERFDPEEMAQAGAFVTVDGMGRIRVVRGFVRPEDLAPAARGDRQQDAQYPDPDDYDPRAEGRALGGDRAPAASAGGAVVAVTEDPDPEQALRPWSDRLLAELAAARTLALQQAVAAHPALAFRVAIHGLAISSWFHARGTACLDIDLHRPRLQDLGETFAEAGFVGALEARAERWQQLVPKRAEELWAWVLGLTEDEAAELFAHLVAGGLSALIDPASRRTRASAHASQLAEAADLDLWEAGWRPTEALLMRLSKAQIAEALQQAGHPVLAATLSELRKSEMVARALEPVVSARWMPPALRPTHVRAVRAGSDAAEPRAAPEHAVIGGTPAIPHLAPSADAGLAPG